MAGEQVSVRTTLLWIGLAAGVLLWLLRDVALLVGYSVLLAYALLAAVKALEKLHPWGRRLPRSVAAAFVLVALFAAAVWVLMLAAPRIAADATHFASNVPAVVSGMLQRLRDSAAAGGMGST